MSELDAAPFDRSRSFRQVLVCQLDARVLSEAFASLQKVPKRAGLASDATAINIAYLGGVDQTLVLEWVYSADYLGRTSGPATPVFDPGYLALDNVIFSQVAEIVPEPASFSLLLFGFGVLVRIRRKRMV